MKQTTLPELSFDDVIERLRANRMVSPEASAARKSYFAMYSSWYGGIIRDPELMMVPIDDHVVHRGDGIFEAMKCVDGRIFGLRRHLERLFRSGELIGLKPPHTLEEIEEIAVQTVRAANVSDCILRLYISRGPGGFTANPYESVQSQMYLVITALKPVPEAKYESGVEVRVSQIAVKEGFFATVKSCNYLPNVLMKKEAVDSGVDFTISRDEHGYLAEGSTENFAIISKGGDFLVPGFARTLRGVTAIRTMELAEKLVSAGLLRAVKNAHITIDEVREAREAMVLGTTIDCLPVTKFEGAPVSDGKVGPICREFLKLLRQDMVAGPLVTLVRT